jgi:hypothetical protein
LAAGLTLVMAFAYLLLVRSTIDVNPLAVSDTAGSIRLTK